jgi:hypothetical protein
MQRIRPWPPVSLLEFEHQVAGSTAMSTGRTWCERLATVGYGWYHFIVDRNQGSPVLGDIAVVRNNDRHGLTDK